MGCSHPPEEAILPETCTQLDPKKKELGHHEVLKIPLFHML